MNPRSLESLAKEQDERNGTYTTVEYLTREQIKEKYGIEIKEKPSI